MPDAPLQGCRILIVEDEYLLADELQERLGERGATIVGPVATVDEAMQKIASEQRIDGAVLDVNLDGASIFPAADLLVERDIPFIFTTGYERSSIPSRFVQVICCQKPVVLPKIFEAIQRAIRTHRSTNGHGYG